MMTPERQKYIALCLKAMYHAHLYYECDAPILIHDRTDYEYDQLYREIEKFERRLTPVSFSPTQYASFDADLLTYNQQ